MILKDPKLKAKAIGFLHGEGFTISQIAEEFEVSRQTVHKAISFSSRLR